MVTKDDNRRFGAVQLIRMVWNGSHWNQPRALDTANSVLRRLPDVDQTQWRASIQELFDFQRGYFNRDVVHNPGVVHNPRV